jgi:hypothetical protein
MTWVAWRQQRATVLVLAAVTFVFGALMLYVRFDMQSFIAGNGLANCRTALETCGSNAATSTFREKFEAPAALLLYGMLFLPLLIGMFLGAPLFSREYEQHTHLLVLSQSISRARWVFAKIGIATVAAVAAMLVLVALYGWMYDAAGDLLAPPSDFSREVFEAQGVLPAVYAVFALVAGAGIGLLLRNTVATMGVTLVVFGIARYGVERIRPDFMAPQIAKQKLAGTEALATAPGPDGAMDIHTMAGYVDTAGRFIERSAAESQMQCEVAGDAACVGRHGFVAVYGTYHGPERYWPFQLIETGIFLTFAALVLGAGLYWLRSRPR